MKIGIYLSGLGEAFTHETLDKYAQRFARQYDLNNPAEKAEYEIRTERFEYDKQHQLTSDRVVLVEKLDGATRPVYVFYEYQYADALTKRFKQKNAFVKSCLLFAGVCVKLPMIIKRLLFFRSSVGYRARFRGQTLYIFLLFFLVSLGILILLPSAISLILHFTKHDKWLKDMVNSTLVPMGLKFGSLSFFVKVLPNLIALLVLLWPGINDELVSLACEFVSASNYLDRGDTKQNIHGQIDLLIEKICEKEGGNLDLYFHSYSFGSLISLDYLFPFGIEPSTRIKQHFKGLITIGSPVEFIKVYFPRFFKGRNLSLAGKTNWLNVYSLADALGSNFRKMDDAGPAQYSFSPDGPLPININYEVANVDVNLFWQFLTFYALKAHGNYWDNEDNGQSCLRLVIPEMIKNGFFEEPAMDKLLS